MGECLECPPGSYCNDPDGTYSPEDCPTQHYCPAGTADPPVCPDGTYTEVYQDGLEAEDQCAACQPVITARMVSLIGQRHAVPAIIAIRAPLNQMMKTICAHQASSVLRAPNCPLPAKRANTRLQVPNRRMTASTVLKDTTV